jgi:hypothetical protein
MAKGVEEEEKFSCAEGLGKLSWAEVVGVGQTLLMTKKVEVKEEE